MLLSTCSSCRPASSVQRPAFGSGQQTGADAAIACALVDDECPQARVRRRQQTGITLHVGETAYGCVLFVDRDQHGALGILQTQTHRLGTAGIAQRRGEPGQRLRIVRPGTAHRHVAGRPGFSSNHRHARDVRHARRNRR